jgi:hypothetical protein
MSGHEPELKLPQVQLHLAAAIGVLAVLGHPEPSTSAVLSACGGRTGAAGEDLGRTVLDRVASPQNAAIAAPFVRIVADAVPTRHRHGAPCRGALCEAWNEALAAHGHVEVVDALFGAYRAAVGAVSDVAGASVVTVDRTIVAWCDANGDRRARGGVFRPTRRA